ncbi:hypothetical protein AAW02_06880 [Aeromonas dhakensis]|nr:hypothetical protein AAW03_15015 [Aeromonas dhakensis]PHS89332.1 hypothetical protein AAW02_06880 [Aeromonas dhakensis]
MQIDKILHVVLSIDLVVNLEREFLHDEVEVTNLSAESLAHQLYVEYQHYLQRYLQQKALWLQLNFPIVLEKALSDAHLIAHVFHFQYYPKGLDLHGLAV